MSILGNLIEKAGSANTDLGMRRQYYDRYALDAQEIFEHCGCNIDALTAQNLKLFARATEQVDHLIDTSKNRNEREQHRSDVIASLSQEKNDALPPSVEIAVSRFRNQMNETGNLLHVTSTIEDMFDLQEDLRSTKDVDSYIDLSLKEGAGLAELLLTVANQQNETADRMFRLMGPTANLCDHMFDAKRDFQNGEIACKPTLHFYLKAMGVWAPKLAQIMAVYPDKNAGMRFFADKMKNAWKTRRYMFAGFQR